MQVSSKTPSTNDRSRTRCDTHRCWQTSAVLLGGDIVFVTRESSDAERYGPDAVAAHPYGRRATRESLLKAIGGHSHTMR